MPGDPLPGAAGDIAAAESYPRRLWRSLASVSPEHDTIIRLIILEKLVKVVLVVGAIFAFIIFGGPISRLASTARSELLVGADVGFFDRLLDQILVYVVHLTQTVTFVVALVAYGSIEGTEGVGLYLRRRWAEYLTVFGTGLLIPYEVYELLRHATLFKAAALTANVGIVVYLAWRKRLFVDV